MLKAIIFDFDGVILESVDVKGWAFRKLFEAFPEHVEEIVAYHYAHGGKPRADKIIHIYNNILKRPVSNDELVVLCDKFSELSFQKVIASDFVPGAKEFLDANRGRYKFFVVSGTPHDEINRVVDTKDLRGYFYGVYGSPKIKVLWTQEILRDNGFSPDEVLWVGDALSDWEAATQNRIRMIARVNGPKDVFSGKDCFCRVRDLTTLESIVRNACGCCHNTR